MSNISSKTVSNTKAQPSTEVSVEIIGGKPTTTSLDVAKHFRKRHDNVLRDIKNLECPEDFALLNFEECSRTGANNRPEPYVRMTRDGFTLLCMGFTGKEAMHWKVAYINAFNKMEQVLIEQPEILSHNHLLQFAIKTLDLMRDHTLGEPARPRTEQVVCNYLAVESLDAATPEQIKQALNFLQGQIIGEGVAAKSLPSVAGSSIAKDLLYGLLRSAHDAELLFNSLYDSGVEKLASDVFKEHMANTLAATSRQTRELLGYVASRATRSPFKPRSTH
ncbi:TPA: Rha family transcriptional regulator [Pseudomonas aeruginosa]|uniref:Rha family transcriptional regulator n=1 Tax=Pseudomonas aeruginosa TaxID=287 RepID=UPI00287F985E|nr:Rha family transcriptional regulator [Pseudomonas aeruginosa]HCF4369811.1 Rha family transcriptional regulator [Pseudomonas aeruginosa]HCF4370585.1 Rha family transcriptional regulator [Pseudomonas aeruginosa]HCF4412817.1 Rha family transcriptional regulator [Pseudomonas aeruginosa]HCF4415269.1 Rha family transcriptional regulator [Pseudomonas aeruginosa]HCF6032111.1 Rha family transcriptional regulator [Pseudomonas aeruginosa]